MLVFGATKGDEAVIVALGSSESVDMIVITQERVRRRSAGRVGGAHICSVYEPHVDFTVTSIDSTDLLFTLKQKKLNTRVVGQTNSTGYTIQCKNVEAQASTHHLLIIGPGQSQVGTAYPIRTHTFGVWQLSLGA
jgi:hypothetical protein